MARSWKPELVVGMAGKRITRGLCEDRSIVDGEEVGMDQGELASTRCVGRSCRRGRRGRCLVSGNGGPRCRHKECGS